MTPSRVPPDSERTGSWTNRTFASRPFLRHEWLGVALLVGLLEIVVFHGYWRGSSIPPWDFLGSYNTEAFAWWRDGSFFSPTHWMPYAWGGYPSTIDVQNSSWYLPVGIASALWTYDLRAAAILSAIHVAFGAVGIYALGRLWELRRTACTIGLVSWFFAAGFYSNAEHLDIMRSYGWLPWVLLCASPRFPWNRWWAPPFAVLVFWQALLAMYPGVVIASTYTIALWVLVCQREFRPRWRAYLAPLAVAFALGASLTLLRFLPAVLVRGVSSPSESDTSQFSPGIVGTLFFPYGSPRLPNDISMRSFFLPVTTLVLCAFASWRSSLARAAVGMILIGGLLGIPSPWSRAVVRLPGMDYSRFRMSDFKVSVLVGLCLLAMAGADRLASWTSVEGSSPRVRKITRPLGAITALVGAAGLFGAFGPYPARPALTQWVLLCLSAGLAWALVRGRHRWPSAPFAALAALAAISGLVAVSSTPQPWRADRVTMEQELGAPIDALLAQRASSSTSWVRRPARRDPGPGLTMEKAFDKLGGSAFYSGRDSVVAYVNLKGAESYERLLRDLLDPLRGERARAFWSAPGMAIRVADDPLPSVSVIAACGATAQCGAGTNVTPISYRRTPELVYRIEASGGPTILAFNEAYYRGWHAKVCDDVGCASRAVTRGPGGELRVSVPAGQSQVRLRYELPGLAAAWFVFGIASLVTLGWSTVLRRRNGSTRRWQRHT